MMNRAPTVSREAMTDADYAMLRRLTDGFEAFFEVADHADYRAREASLERLKSRAFITADRAVTELGGWVLEGFEHG